MASQLEHPTPIILLVLGPHRSGTSLTARMLECLGAANSKNLNPANEYNPQGYFEDWDIYQFNENILMPALNTCWHAVSPIDWRILPLSRREELQSLALELIRKNYDTRNALSVLKDPRISVLLPFWLKVIERAGFAVKAVCPVRDPISVARSLHERNKLPLLTGCLMYFRAWESMMDGLENVASVFLDLQDIFADSDATLRKTADVLDLPLLSDFQKRIDDFTGFHLDVGLLHHKPDLQDRERSLVSIPPHASQLYELLLTCCKTQDVSAAKRFCGAAAKEIDGFLPYIDALDELGRSHTQLNECLGSLAGDNEALRAAIDGAERQVTTLSVELHDQRKAVSDLRASTSWRITSPIRWLGDKVKSRSRLHDGGQPMSLSIEAEQPSEGEEQPASSIIRESWSKRARNELDAFMLSGGVIDLTPREQPLISVVQPVHNRAELTLACLRSLADCSIPLEVIVVDNASTDQTAELFRRIRGVRYIRNRTNMHFLAATNQGAREASSRHLLLLNNDTVVAPGAIEAAFWRINSRPDIGAVGARLILPDGTLQEAGCFVWRDGSSQGYGRGQCPESGEFMFSRTVDFCSGAFLLTPVPVWQELGGFDETYQPAYYEETDYCFRLWESGRTVVYEPRATVFHHEFGSCSRARERFDLMQSHQALFEKRHRKILSGRAQKNDNEVIHLRSRTRVPPRRILVYDERLPYTGLGSGFPRANQLLRKLAESGSEVTFIKRFEEDADTTFPRTDLPRDIEYLSGAYTGKAGIERVLKERPGHFTDFLISRPTSMAELRPLLDAQPHLTHGIDIIYDAEAIWSLREVLEAKMAGQQLTAEDAEARVVSEVSLARGVKRVLAISPLEAAIFEKHGFEASIVGHAVPPGLSQSSWQRREDFLFVGAIHADQGPNFDSVMWFLREVWPILLSRHQNARFIVAGLNKSRQLTEGVLPQGVLVTGAVDDLSSLYDRARAFVAPTRAAAGIPLKVVEAAGRGLPVVATSLLVRQLGWKSPDEILSADTSELFANACSNLYEDQVLWQRQRTNALARIESEYSEKVFSQQIAEALAL